MKNRIILILSVLFAMTSCNKDDKESVPTFLSSQESKSAISQMDATLHSDLTEMVNSEGATALIDLVDLLDMSSINLRQIEAQTRKEKIATNIKTLGKIFTPSMIKKSTAGSRLTNDVQEEFVFADHLGVYEWNAETNDFVKVSSDISYMSLMFPTKGSTFNNANFKLLNYETTLFLEETLPKKIVAELYINEVLEASLNFDVNYSLQDAISSANINLFVSPFDYSLVLNNGTGKESTVDFTILRDDSKMFGVELKVVYTDNYKVDANTIEGAITYKAMSISGIIRANDLENASENQDINDFFDLAVYQNDAKLGDVWIDSTGEDLVVYIVYQDGSKELMEEAFASVIDELEAFVMEINGESGV